MNPEARPTDPAQACPGLLHEEARASGAHPAGHSDINPDIAKPMNTL